ncbi:DUF401 family protein [Streptococcus caprae]|uniref:DUF401 family protein n=1 Tax=Streptococcus caprae TaxID=1640501 RepID=A0ABV8CSQ4_9STRE
MGIVATIVLYQLSLGQVWEAIHNFLTNHDSLAILLSMYLITFLQKMLESRDQIKLAEGDLSRLFQNRRVTISGASLVIGLLPSAAAMVLCADIVKNQTDEYLEKEEQAFVTSWFRHTAIFQSLACRPIPVSFSWRVCQRSPFPGLWPLWLFLF